MHLIRHHFWLAIAPIILCKGAEWLWFFDRIFLPRPGSVSHRLRRQRHRQVLCMAHPALKRRVLRHVKPCFDEHRKARIGPRHPGLLRALAGQAKHALVGGQQAQRHQFLDGLQLRLRVALQQHLGAVAPVQRRHHHLRALPWPPATVAGIVKGEPCHHQAQRGPVGQRRGGQVQARPGHHTLQPLHALHHRGQGQMVQAASHFILVFFDGRLAQRGGLEQHLQLCG